VRIGAKNASTRRDYKTIWSLKYKFQLYATSSSDVINGLLKGYV